MIPMGPTEEFWSQIGKAMFGDEGQPGRREESDGSHTSTIQSIFGER